MVVSDIKAAQKDTVAVQQCLSPWHAHGTLQVLIYSSVGGVGE